MCSMKCATPASAGVSRREPARTYAAMETERAPESRALMTRGPEGSAVRSNIAADGTGTTLAARAARPHCHLIRHSPRGSGRLCFVTDLPARPSAAVMRRRNHGVEATYVAVPAGDRVAGVRGL